MSAGDFIAGKQETPSLGSTVDQWWPFTGRSPGEIVTKTQPLARWEWIRFGVVPNDVKIWRAILPTSQYNSLPLLSEWWNDAIQPEHIGRGARRHIKDLVWLDDSLSIADHDARWYARQAGLSYSRYHEQMFTLWMYEFRVEVVLQYKPIELSQEWNTILLSARTHAIHLAALQRVAHAFVGELLSISAVETSHPHKNLGIRLRISHHCCRAASAQL